MTERTKEINILEKIPLGLVTILGISFWFWLAFPFENRNESYGFMHFFNNSTLTDTLTKNIVGSAELRPMLQFVAYAGYKLSGGTYAQQLFNYTVAIMAWILASLAVRENKIFSITSMIVGGFFFSGYIYLFHLQGVCYSPALLLIAAFIWLFDYRQRYDNIAIALAFLFTLFAWLFHPVALLIFLGYFTGFVFEKRRNLDKTQLLLSTLLILITSIIVILIFYNAGNKNYTSSTFSFTSYKIIELHGIISFISFVLVIATIESIDRLKRPYKLLAELVICILSIYYFYNDIPVLILWIIVSIFKMAFMKKWSMALLILSTATLPLGLLSGTPSYAIYVIMSCSLALPYGWKTLEEKIKFINYKTVLPIYIIASILIILLRTGVNVPILSPLTKPILAEREKTYQLKTVMDWMLNSQYRNYKLILYREKYHPSHDPKGAIKPTHMPPTAQMYVDIYMLMMRGDVEERKDPFKKLVITFGNEAIDNMKLIKTIDGKFAGKAMIFSIPEVLY